MLTRGVRLSGNVSSLRPQDQVSSCMCACSVASDSETLWTVARQDPLSMGFPRQEYRSGLPFPAQTCFPFPAIKTSLTINFLKAFSSDYKRGKNASASFFLMQIQRSVISLGRGLWAKAGPALGRLLSRPRRRCPPEKLVSRPPPLGLRVCDSSVLSKLTPDKKSFCQPWEIWCHL